MSFETAVTQQGHERWHEDEVARAGRADAFHRLVGYVCCRIVQERNQQSLETWIANLANGNRDVASCRSRGFARVADQIDESRLCPVNVLWSSGKRDGGGCTDTRIGIAQEWTRE